MKDVTIQATTLYPPLQYGLDGDKSVNLQDSDTFTGLSAGRYSATVTDSEDDSESKDFEIPLTIDSIEVS